MSVTSESGLLEREGELAAIAALLDAAAEGSGRALLLCGEAGIGKTALVAAACEAARGRGQLVRAAAGGMLEADFAFGVVRELFGRLSEPSLLEGAAAAAAPALGLGAPGERTFVADPRTASFELDHGLLSVRHARTWSSAGKEAQRAIGDEIGFLVDDEVPGVLHEVQLDRVRARGQLAH